MRWLVAIACVSSWSCHAPSPRAGAPVAYRVGWSWPGAVRDGDAWRLTTDRGYTVRIRDGFVGTAALELVPCKGAPRSPLRALLDAMAPRLAFANHGYGHDASLANGELRDAIMSDGARREFASGKTSGKPYCALHELIGPVGPQRWSAYVAGDFAAPGETTRHAFAAHVSLCGGALVNVPPVPANARRVRVEVTRAAVHALDGVDLERATPDDVAYAFLRGVANSTRVEIIVE